MSRHSFDPEVAEKVGLNAAVIFQNIIWWCERNAVKERNIHDGNAWTFNSVASFEALFSYLSGKQIRTALDKLVEVGLLEVGNFNQDSRDRTKWYAVSKGTVPFAQMVKPHLPKKANLTFAQKGEPLPVSKPVSKHTPMVPTGETDLFSAENETSAESENTDVESQPDEIDSGFDEFWLEIWPSHKRKIGKSDCRKIYRQACEGKHPKADKISPAELNRCARCYIKSVRDLEFLKGTLPWLRLPGWEPFMKEITAFDWDDLTPSQQRSLSEGRVPPSMLVDGVPNDAARYWTKTLHGRELTDA